MDAYIYQAALLCEDCGKDVRETLSREGKAPSDPDDEGSYDSDEFPKGPYPQGGGEADSPQHCDLCGEFLENPLTTDGLDYIFNSVINCLSSGSGDKAVILQWVNHYGITIEDLMDHCCGTARRID